jgi:hypothetical protein
MDKVDWIIAAALGLFAFIVALDAVLFVRLAVSTVKGVLF